MTFEELVTQVANFEGFRAKRYKDSGGVLTIGYGFTSNVFPTHVVPEVITKTESDMLLRSILADLQQEIANLLVITYGYELNLHQLYALTSFTYNCGIGNLKKLANYGTRDLDTVGKKILLYNKCNGATLKGLQLRRQWEYDLFFKQLPEKQPVNHTAMELQELVNSKFGYNRLVIDGKIGTKTINAIYELLTR